MVNFSENTSKKRSEPSSLLLLRKKYPPLHFLACFLSVKMPKGREGTTFLFLLNLATPWAVFHPHSLNPTEVPK